jgi:hypothetical protein
MPIPFKMQMNLLYVKMINNVYKVFIVICKMQMHLLYVKVINNVYKVFIVICTVIIPYTLHSLCVLYV